MTDAYLEIKSRVQFLKFLARDADGLAIAFSEHAKNATGADAGLFHRISIMARDFCTGVRNGIDALPHAILHG
jgi:hypothetical protein